MKPGFAASTRSITSPVEMRSDSDWASSNGLIRVALARRNGRLVAKSPCEEFPGLST